MRKALKKVLAFTLAAVLTLGTVTTATAAETATTAEPSPSQGKEPVDQKADADNGSFTVRTKENGGARIIGATTTKNNATVPATVIVNGVKYKVTSIGEKALQNWSNVKTITLGKNVKTIHARSFKNCKSVKTIVVKNSKKVWFSPKSFKGVNTKKMTIKFNKKMSKKTFKKMQKRLKKVGFKGKVTRG